MKVIKTFNYEPLNTVESKYFFGYTGGDKPKQIATSKQLWLLQDIANKLYHYYFCIETASEYVKQKELKTQIEETKRAIDEMTDVCLPISKENMDRKIKLLKQLLESTLPKLANIVEEALHIKSA